MGYGINRELVVLILTLKSRVIPVIARLKRFSASGFIRIYRFET